ncbi:MAG: ParB/RepB/Spo0J family partition protein, partial [Candidatus Hydrothermae bacterium]|nr:ParB/RepB/Spo0J family partition protein [Candidatus Hydrothermae bacterium]
MKERILEIPLESITWDQGIYPREETHPDVVARYAEALEAGAQFPPILVAALPDGHYLILDGNHRLQAHRRVGRRVIEARVVDVDPEDRLELVVLAAKANMVHGLPLSQEERRMVVQRLYRMGMTVP